MYRKNTASQFLCVQLILTATGAVATGLSPAARRCIDGTFAAGGGSFTEDGTTGSYKYAMAQADTNGNDISIIVTATGAIPVCVNFVTTAADPTDAVHFGLSALPNAASNAAGGLPVSSAGGLDLDEMNVDIEAIQTSTAGLTYTVANQIDANVLKVGGTTQTARDIGASVLLSVGTGTGQVNISSGAVPVTSNVKKNVALAAFQFEMLNTAGTAPATGLTVSATRSIDGGAFGACANAVVEQSNGWYKIDLAAGDLNGNVIAFRMSAAGGSDNDFTIITQP